MGINAVEVEVEVAKCDHLRSRDAMSSRKAEVPAETRRSKVVGSDRTKPAEMAAS